MTRSPLTFLLVVALTAGCSEQTGIVMTPDSGVPTGDAGSMPTSDAPTRADAGADAPAVVEEDGGSDVHDAGTDAPVPCWSECPDAGTSTPDAGTVGTDSGPSTGTDAGPTMDTTPVVQLALGDTHTCALRSSGRVTCWGTPTFVGWPAPAVLDATEILAVGIYTYATRMDGTVVRWEGTGASMTVVSEMPAEPAMPAPMYAPGESFPLPTGNYVEIYGTTRDACGRRMNGSVWCWGSNNYGQLARETGELTETGYAFPAGEALDDGARMNATTIGVGAFHRCAALTDGRVVCWGSNSAGQIGRWVTGLETVEPVEPTWY